MTVQSYLPFPNIIGLSVVAITLIVIRLTVYLLKRTWQRSKSQLRWTPVDTIERRSNLSYNEFISKYASVGKPVIITDAMKGWNAMKKWSFDFFHSECGSIECFVKEDEDKIKKLMTIADYIDYITCEKNDKRLYLANWSISCYPQLLDDYKDPIYFPNWLARLPRKLLKKYELDSPELFIGHKDTSIGLHKDSLNGSAWLGMVKGKKQIIIFAPDQEQFLYNGKVNVFNPDLEKFPLYAKANPVKFIIESGEILYIPPSWWHHVKNIENSIALGSSLLLNEWNSELFFQSVSEKSPVKGYLLPLILEFPFLAKILFIMGLI